MWIESHQSVRNHPKVKKSARLAGINEFEMIGRLHCLWWWALDYAKDGDVTKYSIEDIEMAVDWNGTPGAFYSALINCGFSGHCGLLESNGQRVLIHDWHDYAGKLIERRTEDAERKRQARLRMSDGNPQDGAETASVPNQPNQPNQPTEPDQPNQPFPAKPDGMNDLQRLVLATFNAKRFANKTQAAVVAAWDRYPIENVQAALTWAATKGFGLGQAIASLDKALPKWGGAKSGNGHGAQPATMLDVIREAQKDPNYGK